MARSSEIPAESRHRVSIIEAGHEVPLSVSKERFIELVGQDASMVYEALERFACKVHEAHIDELKIEDETIHARHPTTSVSSSATRKPWKIPDPPALTDGKTPLFDDWLSRMKAKLSANADHFPTERHKVAYIQSRLKGKAAEYAAPCFRQDAATPFTTADAIFEHLQTAFFDPHRKAKARRQLRSLRMKPDETFYDFQITFLILAGQAALRQDDYQRELFEKLTVEMRIMTRSTYHAANSFSEYSKACALAYHVIQDNKEHENEELSWRSTAGDNDYTKGDSPPKPARKSSAWRGSKRPNPLSTEARGKLIKEGRCFRCKKRGHISRDCPYGSASKP